MIGSYNPFDIEAPIIPGKSAAGLVLGLSIHELGKDALKNWQSWIIEADYITYQKGRRNLSRQETIVYSSQNYTLFFEKQILTQICVSGNYQGKYQQIFGVGSTMCQAQQQLDVCCIERLADKIEFFGVHGMWFDIARGYSDFCHAPIADIYVFSESEYFDVPGGYEPFCGDCLNERWQKYWASK